MTRGDGHARRFALDVTMTASADFLPLCESRGPYRVESRYASLIMSVPGTRGKNQMASETGFSEASGVEKKTQPRTIGKTSLLEDD